MKRLLFAIVFYGLSSVFLSSPLHAQNTAFNSTDAAMQEIVVSANKIATPADQTTSSVSIVTSEEIQDQQPLMLVDVLRNVPGIFMNTQEGVGGMNGISIRGAHPAYTQYRFNGIPLRDTADTVGNLNNFLSSVMMFPGDASRIEVLKGSQGTLYGSSAIGGVVSIFTEPKWNTGMNARIRLGAGSYGTGTINGEISYGTESMYIDFKPQIMHTDGYRGIWQDQGGYNLSAGYKFNEDTMLEFFSMMSLANHADYKSQKYNPMTQEFDPQEVNDKEYRSTKQIVLNALTLTHNFTDNWQTTAKIAYTQTERTSFADPGQYPPANTYRYRGDNYFADIYNNILLTEQTTFIIGGDYEGQKMKTRNDFPNSANDHSSDMYSVYTKLIQTMFDERLVFNIGGRYNYHEELGSHATWDTGLSYLFLANTRLYGNIATGYRTPSLFETYGDLSADIFSNLDLEPETSINYEIGLEQKFWEEKITLTASVFKTDYKDKIEYHYLDPNYETSWDYSGKYINKSEVKEKGYELNASIIPSNWLRVDLSFVRVLSEAKDENGIWKENDNSMPDNKFIGTVYLYPSENLTLAVTGRWEDSKHTYNLPADKKEDAFFTMDLAATYEIDEHWQIYGKINNLLNEEYTVLGWDMPGITFMSGVQYTF